MVSTQRLPLLQTTHDAIATHHLDGSEDLVVQRKTDPQRAPILDKLKALLAIAGETASGGKPVASADVARARARGASHV